MMDAKEQERLVALRMQGHLPTINICGQSFYVDVRAEQLRAVEDFSKYLPFTSMKMDPLTQGRSFLYDRKEKRLFIPNGRSSSVPERLVVVRLPLDVEMDPIGTARLREYDIELALKEFPIQEDLNATVLELEKESIFYHLELFKHGAASSVGMREVPKDLQAAGSKVRRAAIRHKGRQI